jgi:hypothetical protein
MVWLRSRAGLSASTECSGQPAAGPGWRTVDEVQGSERDAATQLGDRFATAFARCAVSRSCSANLRGRAPSAGSPSRGASGPAYDLVLAGGQQPVEARPDGGHAADLPVSDLSGGGQHPVRTPRTAARPWLHARPAPRAWGRPWRGRSGSFCDVDSHLRSVATFRSRWQCVQRLARCCKSCAVVSATSPELCVGVGTV